MDPLTRLIRQFTVFVSILVNDWNRLSLQNCHGGRTRDSPPAVGHGWTGVGNVVEYERRRFRSLIPSYIRDSNVAAIVYDVSSVLFLFVTRQIETHLITCLTGTTKWSISGMTVK